MGNGFRKKAFQTKVSSLPGTAFVDDARPCGPEPNEKITIAQKWTRRECVKEF